MILYIKEDPLMCCMADMTVWDYSSVYLSQLIRTRCRDAHAVMRMRMAEFF